MAARVATTAPDAAAGALRSIASTGRTAQDELRVVLGVLRDESGAAVPLAPAPGLDELDHLVEQVRLSGTDVALTRTGGDALSPALELTVYRIVQEALTNVVRHAASASAHVRLDTTPDAVRVCVTNGAPTGGRDGARTEPVGHGAGHGIIGMRERVRPFGGKLDAGALEDGGFQVAALIPRRPPDETGRA